MRAFEASFDEADWPSYRIYQWLTLQQTVQDIPKVNAAADNHDLLADMTCAKIT